MNRKYGKELSSMALIAILVISIFAVAAPTAANATEPEPYTYTQVGRQTNPFAELWEAHTSAPESLKPPQSVRDMDIKKPWEKRSKSHLPVPVSQQELTPPLETMQVASTYFNIAGDYQELWKQSAVADWTYAYIVPDLACDDNPDVLVRTYERDPTTGITYTVIAKIGKTGMHLWEESVTGESVDLWAEAVPDLDCDGKADVLVRTYERDPTTGIRTYTVIAKIGKTGMHLWEESVTGESVDLWAEAVPDLDCDGKADVLVHTYERDPTTGIGTCTVIAKIGKTGTHLWEESVTGESVWMWAEAVPDLDCDGKADVLVHTYERDPTTGIETETVIAKIGKTGTHLWEESVTGEDVSMWAEAVPDLDCDGKADVLVHTYERDPTTGISTYTVIAKMGKTGTHLWEESVTGESVDLWAEAVPDLDCDGKADVLVHTYERDPTTGISTCTVIAKIGKTGTHLWEESVTGKDVSMWAEAVPDLDCDGKADVLVHTYEYDYTTGISTCTVIAKIGKTGTHLWEESVTGESVWMWAEAVPDLDCDGKADVLVHTYEYDYTTGIETETVIAKIGKNGTHLWEESVTGKDVSMWAEAVPDLDCDGKADVLVHTYEYDYTTGISTCTVIAKIGKTGTHLWEESVTGESVWMWADPTGDFSCDNKTDIIVWTVDYSKDEYGLIAKEGYSGRHLWDATSNDEIWVAEGYEEEWYKYDLNCDGTDDLLIGISTEMHAITKPPVPAPVPAMTPIGIAALVGLLGLIGACLIVRRR